MEDKETPTEQRKEATNMTDKELDDELQRPTDDWGMDVQREALRRLLEQANL